MDLSDYVFDPVRTGGTLALQRGRRRTRTGSSAPSILVLAPATDHPPPEALRRLEHECSLAPKLDPGWAVRPLAITQDQGRTVLVLEDPGGEPLDRRLGAPMELAPFLRIAIGLCAAIAKLHRRGLLHRDIKPAHVMVDAPTGRCWLTGFGIASRLPRERPFPQWRPFGTPPTSGQPRDTVPGCQGPLCRRGADPALERFGPAGDAACPP